MSEPYRVLITGSRNWPDYGTVAKAITASTTGRTVVIIHGACPTGADKLASEWCIGLEDDYYGVTEEPHPADWKKHGKAAGPIRNQEMVDLGADVCLAFPLGASLGTRDCMRRAESAGIPVVNFGDLTP